MFFSFPSRAWQRLPWWCGLNQQLCLHLAHSFCKSTTLYQRYMVFTIYKTTTIKINLQTNVITKKMLKINQTRNQANSKKNRRTRFKLNERKENSSSLQLISILLLNASFKYFAIDRMFLGSSSLAFISLNASLCPLYERLFA